MYMYVSTIHSYIDHNALIYASPGLLRNEVVVYAWICGTKWVITVPTKCTTTNNRKSMQQ